MIELPLDKDGQVIRIGDVVFDGKGREWQVSSVKYFDDSSIIAVYTEKSFTTYHPDQLTHKKPVTIASLVGDIKRVANQGRVDRKVYEELFRIAWALESLGDSDD